MPSWILEEDDEKEDQVEVNIDENQHPPPLYNMLRRFHVILQSQIQNMIEETRHNNGHDKDTLSLGEFDTKIHTIYTSKSKECAICLDEIKEKSVCSILPCLHCFHETCIKRWLTMNNSSCPICRNSI